MSSNTNEQRFFLNLEENQTLDVEYRGFTFTVRLPSLIEEASVNVATMEALKLILALESSNTIVKMLNDKRSEQATDLATAAAITVTERILANRKKNAEANGEEPISAEDEDAEITKAVDAAVKNAKAPPLNFDKLDDLRFALQNVPVEIRNAAGQIALCNLVVTDIRKDGQEVWMKKGAKERRITSFTDFLTHTKQRGLAFFPLAEHLLGQYMDWSDSLDLDPQEVKN